MINETDIEAMRPNMNTDKHSMTDEDFEGIIEELEAKLSSRLALVMAERDEAWRRAGNAEEQWGRCEDKFSKAVQLLRKHCDTWAMNDFDAETLAELLGEKR
jgi:chemotaxis regulatin CheY-phosphate phosphatase CheZ